jgi:protocatechuate 3,4-dioxygenase beta subunit
VGPRSTLQRTSLSLAHSARVNATRLLHALAVTRLLHALAATIGLAVLLGGIPGARLRSAPDLAPPGVPAKLTDRDATINVAIRDVGDARPIVGAHVRALAIIDDRAYVAVVRETDAAGRVQLAGLPRGDVWLVADAPGRARGSTHVVVDETPRAVQIELAAGHTIRVEVHDEVGVPVASAAIEVVTRGDPLPIGARTGPNGAADVTRLAAGPWRVSARAPGYDESTASAEADGELVALTLHKLGTLRVRVVRGLGAEDREVAGARVEAAGASLWPPRATQTDAAGEVRISGLFAGVYALRATHDEEVSMIDLGVSLAQGEEKSVVLRLVPGRMIGVRVTDGAGDDADPIAGARVTLAEGGLSPFPIEALTDKKGRARLGPIAAGSATVGARAEGFVPLGAESLLEPPPAETRLALVRSAALTGRVVDTRGQPVGGAILEIAGTDPNGGPIFDDPRRARFQAAHFDAMLKGPTPLMPAGELGVMPGAVPPIPLGSLALPRSGAGFSSRPESDTSNGEPWVTRNDGTFRAVPTSPGRIRAIAHHPQYVDAESEVVTLAPGGEAHVDIVLRQGAVVEGRVLDARDQPVAGARVFVSATRGTLERTTRTASDGTFGFAALPESVTLAASANDDDTPDVRMALVLPEGGREEVTIHLPEPREALAVSVVDRRGFPVDAVQVSVSSLSVASPLRTTVFTDPHGEARLLRARGLPLRVEVRAPAYAPRVITTDGTGDTLRIELLAAESAVGEVVAFRGGGAIAGAEVTLYTDLGARRTHTGSNGLFALSELAAGSARLRVRAAGFAPTDNALAIPETGGRRPYAVAPVSMTEEGVVEGDVVDERGEPVAGARVAKDHVPTWLLVGSNPNDVAVTDARGRFALHELAEGVISLEAYAPDLGRARATGVRVAADRTTDRVHLVIGLDANRPVNLNEPAGTAGVAITLGETGAPVEVVVISVVEASEAERAGVAPGDVLLAVDDTAVTTMEQARAKLSGPITDDVILRVRRGDRTLVVRTPRDPLRR